MFGYHDSPYCKSDIWSPNPTRWGNNAIENRAFSPYAKHQTELDEVVEMIAAGATSIELDDDFCQSDLDYIQKQLAKRGIDADLSLS